MLISQFTATRLAITASLFLFSQCHADPQAIRPRQSIGDVLRTTATGYIDSFNNPGPDLRGVIAYRTDGCLHHFEPDTLGIPPINNAKYLEFSGVIRQYISGFTLTQTQPMIIYGGSPVVTLTLGGSGTLVTDNEWDGTEYRNAYTIDLTMTLDGKMIEKIVERPNVQLTEQFLEKAGLTIDCLLNNTC